ncbi:hypothetical protein [Helicobacter canadensis]|uniref:Uncharacterized protein n=1 Tax=Helicobacter canadensis MIT 98-5491 TaxID=537970 RepID=C5ZZ20_9HELI|nr:hypothetical protein [Helicobacter canadensis]EES89278.1 conserved hypothetical protein [Helicobacter canadensis MIT 98-5491]EFR48065.1 hypothetical protein HCMG_00238 [Helicobacter canadensis MIT 98-5491]STO99313.1 Uncharacterised protein [Helicobacter canadensis]
MKCDFALQEITKKLDEIKEVWQIYEIFEKAKKDFNEEYESLSKDRDSLIQSFNETSAKNALLLSQNQELETQNKVLEQTLAKKQKALEELDSKVALEGIYFDFSNLESLCEDLKAHLEKIDTALPAKPNALQKLEVSYQQHQKLVAKPANSYVTLAQAQELYERIEVFLKHFKSLDLEIAKILLEVRDLKNQCQEKYEDSSKESL